MAESWCSTKYRRRRLHRDEILVKIRSTAVNHLDRVNAQGAARQILPIDLPLIPGHEFQGWSNRLAIALRNGRQAMPCSASVE